MGSVHLNVTRRYRNTAKANIELMLEVHYVLKEITALIGQLITTDLDAPDIVNQSVVKDILPILKRVQMLEGAHCQRYVWWFNKVAKIRSCRVKQNELDPVWST